MLCSLEFISGQIYLVSHSTNYSDFADNMNDVIMIVPLMSDIMKLLLK